MVIQPCKNLNLVKIFFFPPGQSSRLCFPKGHWSAPTPAIISIYVYIIISISMYIIIKSFLYPCILLYKYIRQYYYQIDCNKVFLFEHLRLSLFHFSHHHHPIYIIIITSPIYNITTSPIYIIITTSPVYNIITTSPIYIITTSPIYIIPSLYLPVSGWVLASRPPFPAFPPGRTHHHHHHHHHH